MSALSVIFSLFGVNWDAIDARIAREFPTVTAIHSDELLTEMNAPQSPLLVDVREPAEYAVSHLPAAQNWQTAAEVVAAVSDKNAEVIVYCSVGYRSAAVAAELEKQGFTRVRNLHHSIFAWANEGKPLVNSVGETDKVHPYNRAWGSLVDASLRQSSP